MGAGAVVLGALKTVGSWVLSNPNIALDAVDKVAKIQADKKSLNNEEFAQVVDEKLNQLGAAALELEQKIDEEVSQVYKQMRTMKIILSIMGVVLGMAIITIVILAFQH